MEEEVVMEGSEKNGKGSPIKKIIIAVIAILVIIAIIIGIVKIVKPTPEKTVKEFVKAINKEKASNISKLVDLKGLYTFASLDSYKDFKDEYKDFDEKWEEIEDDAKDQIEEFNDDFSDKLDEYEEFSVEIKSIKKPRKVSGNLYSIKAKIKTVVKEEDEKTDRDTSDYVFYVLKKENKYYLVGITGGDVLEDVLNDMLIDGMLTKSY